MVYPTDRNKVVLHTPALPGEVRLAFQCPSCLFTYIQACQGRAPHRLGEERLARQSSVSKDPGTGS